MELSHSTRGDASPTGKPRVYFTCHPNDFEATFEKVRDDLLEASDCAVYYTSDMAADFADEEGRADLGRMNLFVIPVTRRLLAEPNRAMDSDFRFAQSEHIPVLPLLMEQGAMELYGDPDRFGEIQFIDPYSVDPTEIGYADKLRSYLESVLVSDETAERIRTAFDAYIFLSYRKKDRRHANELMRLVHDNPEFRDVAVWFDEFLTPGESFTENIGRMLERSDLFALLVTPSLLECPDGRPNYVMAEEYPAARELGKPILPAEMVATDEMSLRESYVGLPSCVDARDDAAFRERLLETIGRTALARVEGDAEHDFLIGLAYLNGIDVERNAERGVELIESAGKAYLPEAMRRLATMYWNGEGVERDLEEGARWQRRLADHLCYEADESERDDDVYVALKEMMALAEMDVALHDYDAAAKSYETAYRISRSLLFTAASTSVGAKLRGFFRKVTKPSPYAEDVAFMMSEAGRRMVELSYSMGRAELLEEWQRRAVSQAKSRVRVFRNARAAVDLISLYNLLVEETLASRNLSGAQSMLDEATECWERLDESERTFEARLCAAGLERAKSLLSESFGEPSDIGWALDHEERRIKILETLHEEAPDAYQVLYGLIDTLLREADLCLAVDEPGVAANLLERAEGLLDEAPEASGDRALEDITAGYLSVRAKMAVRDGDAEGAVSLLERALETIHASATAETDAERRRLVADLREQLGDVHVRRGDYVEAKAAYREAVGIREYLEGTGKLVRDTGVSAGLYEKLLDVALAEGDRQAIEEWNEKALWKRRFLVEGYGPKVLVGRKSMAEAVAKGLTDGTLYQRDVDALNALQARQPEIRRAIRGAGSEDGRTLRDVIINDREPYFGYPRDEMTAAFDAFAERHAVESGRAKLRALRDIFTSVESMKELGESESVSHLQMKRLCVEVRKFIGDRPSPAMKYDEAAMVLYYLCTLVDLIWSLGNQKAEYGRLLDRLRNDEFMDRPFDEILYPSLWTSLTIWVIRCEKR